MARLEKTVFISYRRTDISWALAVYQYLTSEKYDVFFDFSSLSSGDFEQVIVSNIRARAHFIIILTPTALDRCAEPGDWLRREIETAIDEKRNIIPLLFEGFNFGSLSIAEKLTGKLAAIRRYNGLDIPSGYFLEAMGRLKNRYLNVPLNAVIHPISTEIRRVVKEEQIAVDEALERKQDQIKEIFKPIEEPSTETQQIEGISPGSAWLKIGTRNKSLRLFGIGAGVLLLVTLALTGINGWLNRGSERIPTLTSQAVGSTLSGDPSLTPPGNTAAASQQSNPTRPATFTAAPLTVATISTTIASQDTMTMVYVPAGEFTMGSDSGDADEAPPHTVTLDAFWIDRTEITNAMFTKFVQATGYTTDAEKAGKSRIWKGSAWQDVDGLNWLHPEDPSTGISDLMDYPVIHVSWTDANAYCSWATRRLPTEAEWEKAADWDDQRNRRNAFPWGNEFNGNLLNFCDKNCSFAGDKSSDDGFKTTAPVGSFPGGASAYGALDMAGNVWEWVSDWYDTYDKSPAANPKGPESGTYRVLRGGSWSNTMSHVRAAERGNGVPWNSYFDVGFRCARSATP